jgi:hypothetical protein
MALAQTGIMPSAGSYDLFPSAPKACLIKIRVISQLAEFAARSNVKTSLP